MSIAGLPQCSQHAPPSVSERADCISPTDPRSESSTSQSTVIEAAVLPCLDPAAGSGGGPPAPGSNASAHAPPRVVSRGGIPPLTFYLVEEPEPVGGDVIPAGVFYEVGRTSHEITLHHIITNSDYVAPYLFSQWLHRLRPIKGGFCYQDTGEVISTRHWPAWQRTPAL